MSIVMNMSSYVIEETTGTEIENGDKRVGQNSPLQLSIQQQSTTMGKKQTAFPSSLATVNVEVFLQKMSSGQF